MKKLGIVLLLCLCASLMAGCMSGGTDTNRVPEIPERLERNADGVPMIKLYDAKTKSVSEIDLETYIMGVVAGEMKNDWPEEALKAQAILARTYTMKFVSEKKSQYADADISTDVQEAQAYDADSVNDRVRSAVNDTRGIVMTYDGEFPYAWFHSHSGGVTELPTMALDYSEDPAYLESVESTESEKAPEYANGWTAKFTMDEVIRACKNCGVELNSIESFKIGKKGQSGRAAEFLVNGQSLSAPTFRLQIGASKLKSTLIDSITMDESSVTFTGKGIGHGVGLSQWGAYQLAEDGKKAEDIISHYFKGIEYTKLW